MWGEAIKASSPTRNNTAYPAKNVITIATPPLLGIGLVVRRAPVGHCHDSEPQHTPRQRRGHTEQRDGEQQMIGECESRHDVRHAVVKCDQARKHGSAGTVAQRPEDCQLARRALERIRTSAPRRRLQYDLSLGLALGEHGPDLLEVLDRMDRRHLGLDRSGHDTCRTARPRICAPSRASAAR